MAFALKINGEWVTIDEGATWEHQSGARGTFSCSITSEDGSYRPGLRLPCEVYEDGVFEMGGVITYSKERGALGEGLTAITTDITISDNNIYGERTFVNGTLPAGSTVEDALTFAAGFLAGHGVTLDPEQATGPALPALTYDYVPVADLFYDIAEHTGWIAEIDKSKVLRAVAPAANPAPFGLEPLDGNTDGDFEVEQSVESYANFVILQFAAEARAAYAFFVGVGNFTDGETTKLGSQTYTWKTTLTDSAGYVLIGADLEESLSNLAAAIVRGAGAGTVYAEATSANSAASAYVRSATMLTAVALSAGASGNSIACETTAGDAAWVGEGNVPLATLHLGADRALTNVVFASDEDEIEDFGPWYHKEQREDIVNPATAQSTVEAMLAERLQIPKRVSYPTLQTGIRPGQSQPIDLPIRGVDSTFVVATVSATENATGTVRRAVTADEGSIVRATTDDVVRSWSGGSSSRASVVAIASEPSTPVFTRSRLHLALSAIEWVQSPTDNAIVAASAIRQRINTETWGSLTATCFARLRSRTGAAVTAYVWDVTNNVQCGASAPIASTTFVAVTPFNVDLTEGDNEYELRLSCEDAEVDMNGVSYVE